MPKRSDPIDLADRDYERLLAFRTGLRRFLHWSEEQSASVGLSAAQHQLLLAIRGSTVTGGPTIGDVAESLLLRHHSAVGLVDRAEAGGLVRRIPDDDDHRVVRLAVTAKGRRKLRRLARQALEELDRLQPVLTSVWRDL
jgi:DNA-binding MarR family transcriptional regulator